jgi:hypothetical protein
LIDQDLEKVVITAPGTYKFEATNSDPNNPSPNGLGNIRSITIDPNSPVQGTVNVYVSKANDPYNLGVRDLYCIDLSGATVGNIVNVRAEGNIAIDCDVHATSIGNPYGLGILFAHTFIHDIYTQYLNVTIACHGLANLTVSAGTGAGAQIMDFGGFGPDPYTGTIDVTGSLDWLLMMRDMAGTISVTGDVYNLAVKSLAEAGSVTVDGDLYYADIYAGDLDGDLDIVNGHALLGELWVDEGSLSGNVTIGGDLGADGLIYLPAEGADLSGTVTIHGDAHGDVLIGTACGEEWEPIPQPPPNDLTGQLTILGDADGTIHIKRYLKGEITFGDPANPAGQLTDALVDICGSIWDESGDLSGGHINIYGSFGGMIAAPGGFAGSTEYVAIDANGGDLQDSWGAGCVRLGNTLYWGNTPSMHLWDVSDCRGDFNSDWVVDIADLNLFLTAVNNPTAYALAYPGLGTSRVLHGDCNCDGTFNGYDRASFLDRLARECCDVECPGCQGGRGTEGGGDTQGPPDLPAEDLAAELAANVWPELYDGLLAMVLETIDAAPNEEVQAYWQTVYATLTQ